MRTPVPGSTGYSTPSEREIRIERHFNAPRSLVYAAWSDPKHVPRWMSGPEGWSMPVCEIDLRPGGKWRYVLRMGNGAEMTLQGVYREVVPMERVVTTESWGPDWPESLNTMELTEANGITTMVITILYNSRKERDAALESGMKQGMDQGFALLDQLLVSLR